MPSLSRWLCIGFGTLLILIITLANKGLGGQLWGFLASIPFGDKLGHVLLLGTFSFLLHLSLPHHRRAPSPLSFISLPSLIVALIITAEELSQAFSPYRSFDLLDGIANLVGIFLGELAARLTLHHRFPSP